MIFGFCQNLEKTKNILTSLIFIVIFLRECWQTQLWFVSGQTMQNCSPVAEHVDLWVMAAMVAMAHTGNPAWQRFVIGFVFAHLWLVQIVTAELTFAVAAHALASNRFHLFYGSEDLSMISRPPRVLKRQFQNGSIMDRPKTQIIHRLEHVKTAVAWAYDKRKLKRCMMMDALRQYGPSQNVSG